MTRCVIRTCKNPATMHFPMDQCAIPVCMEHGSDIIFYRAERAAEAVLREKEERDAKYEAMKDALHQKVLDAQEEQQ